MESILHLNLHDPNEKDESANLPKPDRVESDPEAVSKRLNQIANRAAHKGAAQYGRGSTGIFSK
jgi:hypothetical protein